MVSDVQKRARNKWDKDNMVVLGCKVKRADAEAFKAACKAAGTTVNAVFTEAMRRFLDHDTRRGNAAPTLADGDPVE